MRKVLFGFRLLAAMVLAAMVFTSCKEDEPVDTDTGQDADIVAFTFDGIDGQAAIDKSALTVTAKAVGTADLTAIVAEFALSEGATAHVGSTAQVSGQTRNNFTNPVVYTVTSGNGRNVKEWRVTVSRDDIPPPGPNLPPVDAVMRDMALSGVVRNTGGEPVEGVGVSTGTLTATTDEAGFFAFTRAATVNGRTVIRFEKDGYFPITRSSVEEDEMMIEIVMQVRGNTDVSLRTSFSASESRTLSVGGMEVEVPASSMVRADGSAYSGSVNADMFYLDPNNGNFNELMPGGDLAAIRADNSGAQLISYGMTEVSLFDESGNPLQLKEGAASRLTFPIPAGMENNPPAVIPLWYFDEERGLWIEEGTASLQGNVYVGSVRHFSWHNLDYPEDRVEIKGKVTDCDGLPVPYTRVTVDQTSDFTNNEGEYSVYVPANTPVTVTVKSRDYQDYSPEVTHSVPGRPGGSVVTQHISLPCVPKLRGRIVNTCGPFVSAFVWLEYTVNGQKRETTPVYVTSSGTFTIYFPSGASGQAVVHAEALEGTRVSRTVNLTGSSLEVTVELCMDINEDENILTFTQPGKAPYLLPIDYDRVQVFASDEGLMMFDGSMFVLYIPEYSKAKKSYDNVSVVIAYQDIVFATEEAHVEILSHGDILYSFINCVII